MRVSAKTDYALRALAELASRDGTVPAEVVAHSQDIPLKYLGSVLTELRHHGFVSSHNGTRGGYRVKHPELITVAEVIRVTSGPLVSVRGEPLEEIAYAGAAEALSQVWDALRTASRLVLESVTIADIARKDVPMAITSLPAVRYI